MENLDKRVLLKYEYLTADYSKYLKRKLSKVITPRVKLQDQFLKINRS